MEPRMMTSLGPQDISRGQNQSLVEILGRVVTRLAKQQSFTIAMARTGLEQQNLTTWGQKRIIEALLKISGGFRVKGNYGRLRTAILVGFAYKGTDFLTPLERTGVLLSDGHPPMKFGAFLDDFQRAITLEPDWRSLQQRLKTYQAYHQLALDTADDEQTAVRILKSRPRTIIKKILALSSLSFLRAHFSYRVAGDITSLLDEMGEPEDAARIASLLVALANKHSPLDSWDLGGVTGDLTDHNLIALVRCGRILVARHRVAKEVSIFGYNLHYLTTPSGVTYHATPPSSAFEIGRMLGYIRMENSARPFTATTDSHNSTLMALKTVAEVFFTKIRKQMIEIRDPNSKTSRIRLNFPILPDLYRDLTEVEFYDDILQDDRLAPDFLLPLRTDSGESAQLTSKITVEMFLRIWRLIHFLSLVDIAALEHYHQTEPTAANNSIVRIMKEAELIELIATLGVDSESAREFIRLVAADVNSLGYYDLQYWPLLKIAKVDVPEIDFYSSTEFVLLPAAIATSNVLRNVQIANSIRLKNLPQQFVEALAVLLRSHFTHVAVNREVKMTEGKTDVDVVLLLDNCLFLFECKHSVFPSEIHELRDVWEDIEKGVQQLQLATRILADDNRRRDYLAGWFPSLERPHPIAVRVVPCVISSHRIFSGIHHNGVAIRDYASLNLLATDGIISTGTGENGGAVLHRFRITEAEAFSIADLLDYLSPKSKYFSIITEFMRPVSSMFRAGNMTIAHETYVGHLMVEDIVKYMEAMGYQRLSDVASAMQAPRSLEQVVKDLEQLELEP
jgi:hypothetical protein